MTKADLLSLTIVELKALAKKKKVALPANARKADIIKTLAAKMTAAGAKPRTAKTKTATRAAAAGKKTPAKPARKKAPAPKNAVSGRQPAVKRSAERAAPMREWRMPPGPDEALAAQERIEGAKYYTGPSSLRPSVSGSLPQGYGEERIALLVRDPQTAFAYWELPQGWLDQERARAGADARLCIRIYDVTGVLFDGTNASAFFDQEVYERIGSWYFDLGRSGRSFCAELGLRSADGNFRTLVRSNVATMPRESFSDALDEGAGSEEEFLRLYGLPGRGLSSPQLQELMRKRRSLEISSPGQFGRKSAGPRRG
jgi:hypothetical protein